MRIEGERIFLRLLDIQDTEKLLEFNLRNRSFFQQYSPLSTEDYYTLAGHFEAVKKCIHEQEEGRKYTFGIFLKDCDTLIGSLMLAYIQRGPLQSCILGYDLDQQQNGKGYATEAVRLAVELAFNELKLHRIEAGVMPRNKASARVLEKAGFNREGIACQNVKINGKWEDHQVFALINPSED